MLKDEHWNQIALKHDQPNMKLLLKKLYSEEKLSLEKCSEVLDLSMYTTRHLLRHFGLTTQQEVSKKLNLSYSELRKGTLGQLAMRHGVSKSTIWRMQQAVKKRTTPGEVS